MKRARDDSLERPVRTFLRFFRFILPYWDKLLFLLLGTIVASPLSQLGTLFHKAIIDRCVMDSSAATTDRLMGLAVYTGLAAVMLWTSRLLDVYQSFLWYYLNMWVTLDLRRLFYKHLHRLPLSFFQGRPIGEHMYRVLEDVRAEGFPNARGVVDMITETAPRIFRIVNDIVWQGLLVFFLNPMAMYVMVGVIVPYTILSHWMNTRIKRAYAAMKGEEQVVPAILRDSIAGVETVKSYGRRRRLARQYVHQFVRSIRATFRRDLLTVTMDQVVFWVLDLVAFGGLWTWLVYQMMIGEISVGSFTVILGVSARFVGPFKSIIAQWQLIRQQLVPARRILETLDVEPAIQDRPNAVAMPPVRGRLRFQSVAFAYDPAVPVLRDVSFEIGAGQTLGIVGPSGAGKTTILNLILRLQRPVEGRILIDDYDLDLVRIQDWQEQTAVVLQNTFIFGGDVAYNIRYGRLDASDDEIWDALRMADADGFVRAMPQGLHTDLSEGSRLSGGQRQRLGIARALIRRPRVLVLDEPTSSLDSRTENEIWRSFEKAMAICTAVVISHRLTTVRRADQIIVLDAGRIVEHGRHEELIGRGGLYHQMWLDQTGGSRA